MTTWNTPLQLNNLEAQIQQQIATGLTNPLNANVIGNGKSISGLSGNPVGSTAINIGGTQSWVIASTDLTPLLQVSNSAVILGDQFSGTQCQAKTVSPATTNDNQIATTAFVQSAISAGTGNASTINITDTNTNATFYPTFTSNTGASQTVYADRTTTPFTYNPSTGTLATANFSGLASDATNVRVANTNANSTHYLTFTDTNITGQKLLQDTTGITVNPNTNSITATTFNGALNGNASTATSATSATNATNATNTAITASTTNASFYPTFVSATTGNLPQLVDSTFTYNPSTDTLTVANVAGNASTATTATNATNTAITASNVNATVFPTFVSASTGNLPQLVDTGFTYNPLLGDVAITNTLKIHSAGNGGRVAVGDNAGLTSQGATTVAIGSSAGSNTQGGSSVAIGNSAGSSNQGNTCVAIGFSAGQTTQGLSAVSIGNNAGNSNQGARAIAIGLNASTFTQSENAISIGSGAGNLNQGNSAVAVGANAGNQNQSGSSVAVGLNAGGSSQGASAVAIGSSAGNSSQGASAVAIGNQAGATSQHANSIILNASGVALNSNGTSRFFVNPIRGVALGIGIGRMVYDPATSEITYSTT